MSGCSLSYNCTSWKGSSNLFQNVNIIGKHCNILLRLSSQKPKTSRLTTPLTSLRITLIFHLYFPCLCTMYIVVILCHFIVNIQFLRGSKDQLLSVFSSIYFIVDSTCLIGLRVLGYLAQYYYSGFNGYSIVKV